ncbi:phosphoinositide phospholipase C 2 isoform X2 [Morus notabilis]|uniref:phosphoinositide phospholipase C 2 isoform X2 n=1 Tax=Morus notabilis TaxID=981085 RepID=UPI000CED5F6E|nr:phosphoinositide phospholipase C 2 isoform X2 [Morus notabilis]
MTLDHLVTFLKEVQGEEYARKEDAQAIFESLKHLKIFHRNGLHLDAFFRYLLGDLNHAHTPMIHHDMNAPLAHYYLFTGHNSYLTGNQLSSDSSVVPITKALRRGVRVIELDLWPNSAKNDVEVCHGGTLTSPVALKDCLRAIKDNAFVASEYPVVITFEDHLTPTLQAKVAKMVTKTFGNMLYCPLSDYLVDFPSPEILKKRVLISTKPPEYRESQHGSTRKKKENLKDHSKDDEEDSPNEAPDDQDSDDNDREEDDDEDEDDEHDVPEYKQLIAIHAGKPKGEFQKWLADAVKVRRLSLSEQQLENAAKTNGTHMVRFTQRNFLRIYPKGMRLDSSNYNPMLGWMHGAQMVAFNMQGHGKYLWIMQGMFRSNGGCGYVKKPDFLLNVGPENEVFDPKEILPVKKTLQVKVYMGEGWHSDFRHTHFDRFSPPDFFVKVGIAGVPRDSKMRKTKAVEDEWTPVWNEEFEFPLTIPELALLRVEALEYDTSGNSDFGGQTCLPISELKTGIRSVPLNDRKGDKYKNVRLLMSFQFV